MTLPEDLQEFAERLRTTDKPFDQFSEFLQKCGVKGFSYGFAVLRAELQRNDRTKSIFFTHSFSNQWEVEIGSGPFLDRDPAIELMISGIKEYEWAPPNQAKLLQELPKLQRRQIETEIDLGLNYGMTLMLDFSKSGFSGVGLWFENQSSAEAFRKEWAHFGPMLYQAGHLLDQHVRKENPNTMVGLSRREVDCLNLLLAGYRASEICWKLGITEKTLEKHMLHARTKLKAFTRDQALAKAVLLGLVTL